MLFTGTKAKVQLAQAKSEVRNLASNQVSREPLRIARIIERTDEKLQQANNYVHDPVWWIASKIPYFGRTPAAIRVSVSSLAEVVHAVAKSDDTLARYQRPSGKLVDQKLLDIAGKILQDVRVPATRANQQLQQLKLSGVPTLLAAPVTEVRDLFATAQPYIEQGQTFLKIAPVLLGLDEPKTWLLIMNNGAEARATGGMPGGWAILAADAGRLTLDQLETNSGISAKPLRGWEDLVSPDLKNLYGNDLARFADMNLSPDFPTNARLINALYQQHSGSSVDGVLSIDQFTLAGLMVVTGPVNVGQRHLTSGNVVDYVTKGVYADYPNPNRKDEAVMDITRRVFKHLSYSTVHDIELARAFIPSIYRGRLHFWSVAEGEQALIAQTQLSGSTGNTRDPSHMAVVINAAGNKIDAYVQTDVTYTQKSCLAEIPYRHAQMQVILNNSAPKSGLPSYVTPRNDKGFRDRSQPGSTLSAVFIHAPLGSEFQAAFVNGKEIPLMNAGWDHNRQVWELHVELPASAKRTLRVDFVEPVDQISTNPQLWVQPMAIPMTTHVQESSNCGFTESVQ